MATIRIADDAHPRGGLLISRSETQSSQTLQRNSNGDGIYNIRSRSRAPSHDPRLDDDPGLRKEGDFKQKQVDGDRREIVEQDAYIIQVFKGKMLLWLAYQSIGVIYGDIGTSPLYVFSSTFPSAPAYDDLVGVLSIIIWSLFMMVTVKYVLIILRADNEGEGGTFSTYSLLSRYVRWVSFLHCSQPWG